MSLATVSRQRAPRIPIASANFDVTESAEFLGVSVPTVFRLLREGTLPRIKLRRRTLIPKAACEALLRKA